MIYTVYAEKDDMTFIMSEECKHNKRIVSVIGWYYGEPNEDNTELFMNDLTAEFDD